MSLESSLVAFWIPAGRSAVWPGLFSVLTSMSPILSLVLSTALRAASPTLSAARSTLLLALLTDWSTFFPVASSSASDHRPISPTASINANKTHSCLLIATLLSLTTKWLRFSSCCQSCKEWAARQVKTAQPHFVPANPPDRLQSHTAAESARPLDEDKMTEQARNKERAWSGPRPLCFQTFKDS